MSWKQYITKMLMLNRKKFIYQEQVNNRYSERQQQGYH